MPKSEKFDITLHHSRSTPGSHLFEVHPNLKSSAGVQNLYIKKTAFANRPAPKSIKVTVEYDPDAVVGS